MNLRVDVHDLGKGGGLVSADPLLAHPDRVVSPPASQACFRDSTNGSLDPFHIVTLNY